MAGFTRLFAPVLFAFVLAGCSSNVKVGLRAGNDLNSSGGSALPVVVRVYQLSEDTAFKNAGFHDLWKREQATLGPTLISVKEIVMRPDSEDRLEMPLDENTKFIAGIALFRSPGSSKWGFISPVSNNAVAKTWHKAMSVSVDVHLTQNRIEIEN